MVTKIGSGDEGDASADKTIAPSGEGAAAGAVSIVDAGAAPIDQVRRAGGVSAKAKVIGAKPSRSPAARPNTSPEMPLNPLRAGSAVARAATQLQAAPQVGDEIAPTVIDAGPAPKMPVGKKPRSRKPVAKARPTRSGKRKK
jgi:hypothetical protein